MLRLKVVSSLFLMALAVGFSVAAKAETFAGSNVDSRLMLAFQVEEVAAQEWLPSGWSLIRFPQGPLTGANLIVAFYDRHLALDPEGQPASPPSYRAAVLASLAKEDGGNEVRIFVTRVYAPPEYSDPYKVHHRSELKHEAGLQGETGELKLRREQWQVRPEGGGEMSLKLSYEAGVPSWSHQEQRPYSAADPDASRLYRQDQLTHLVMSQSAGKELSGEVDFKSTIPELERLFDGSEKLIGIIDVPVYVRQVFLP